MQVQTSPDAIARFIEAVAGELPGLRGLAAWQSLLKSHATLMRRLGTDLESKTGLSLTDYDVLAQLAGAGGELRITELAARALISGSGMTRRVAHLVDRGLVTRVSTGVNGRGVIVALTDAGLARLLETTPVHARGVHELFVALLNDQELAALETTLDKVTVETTFG
ncbi:MAG TPA: MarR family winged helix-turn-helix transcriptional regulator [Candidatus Bathyarchaeia archaeon]|jgi:DNA-binding MarR family transcriptional regulator|nr:MarR family winged helix-turn-helix transcriptional regulator [Candidatus Bathyarchaeia archaeon]